LQDEIVIRALLAVGALLVVPLALPLVGGSAHRRAATWLLPLGSVGFAAAMVIGSGPVAVALALPWIAGAALLAFGRLVALRVDASLDQFAVTLAAFWLTAAGIVACLALTGPGAPLTPEHLRWPTPAHFLYAGFGLTTVALATRRARRSQASRVALLGVLAGMPLLALEIAFFASTQWTGALFIGTAALVVAGEQLLVARRANQSAALVLIASSLALAVAMVLAIGYGLATRFSFSWLSLDTMVQTHGVLNSLGFMLLGVIGWRIHTARGEHPRGRRPEGTRP
jgi:hypothetical protein